MGKVYTTQDSLRIELSYKTGDHEQDLNIAENIVSVIIKYIKPGPDGGTGQWDAVHDTVNFSIYYDLPLGEYLTPKGSWRVWSVATMSDGRVLVGEPARFLILNEGQ